MRNTCRPLMVLKSRPVSANQRNALETMYIGANELPLRTLRTRRTQSPPTTGIVSGFDVQEAVKLKEWISAMGAHRAYGLSHDCQELPAHSHIVL